MKKIVISRIDSSGVVYTHTFEGDEYSVATFGDKDVILAVLETVGEDNERPVLMIPCAYIETVEFSYED